MTVWKETKNTMFHGKKIWSKYTDSGVCSGLNVQIGSSIYARKNEKWVPDTRRGWGMVRENPIIRYASETVIYAAVHGGYDRYETLFVSWNQIPSIDDSDTYAAYLEDTKHPGFLGVSKSGSAVKSHTMKWMKEQ